MIAKHRLRLTFLAVVALLLAGQDPVQASDEMRFGGTAAQATPVILDKGEQIRHLLMSDLSNERKARELQEILRPDMCLEEICELLQRFYSGDGAGFGRYYFPFLLDNKTQLSLVVSGDRDGQNRTIQVASPRGTLFVIDYP